MISVRRERRGLRWTWALAGALVIALGLVATQAFSASMSLKAHPLQSGGTDGKLTKSANWSSATAWLTRHESTTITTNGSNQVTGVTVGGTKVAHSGNRRVTVTLKDSGGATLDSGTANVSTASGSYSTAVTMSAGTVSYPRVATASAAYTGPTSTSLGAAADTYVDNGASSSNFGTNTTMSVQAKKNLDRRVFVSFSVSSIPSGSTIDSATLTLCASAVPTSTRTYEVRSASASWAETTVTWANQPAVAASPTNSATTPATAGCMSWTVTSDVQAWVNGTATNNGWRVNDSVENSGPTYLTTFATRENGTAADRPALVVNYWPP